MIRVTVFVIVVFLLSTRPLSADIVTRFGDGTIFQFGQNSGTVSIPIQIRASNNELGFTAYLTNFSITPPAALGGASLISLSSAGNFNQPGDFGAGNIVIGNASFFNRNSATTAQLSLEFSSPQTALSNFQTLARMNIDTTNLPTGTYAVNVIPQGVEDLIGTNFTTSGIAGSFSIVAIPEPSSLWLWIASVIAFPISRLTSMIVRAHKKTA